MHDGQVGLNSHLTREPVKFRDDAFCVKRGSVQLCDLLSCREKDSCVFNANKTMSIHKAPN